MKRTALLIRQSIGARHQHQIMPMNALVVCRMHMRIRVRREAAALVEVLAADGKEGLIVAAGKNAVRVCQLQVPGGKPMDARDYLRGHAMAAGTMLKEDTENE